MRLTRPHKAVCSNGLSNCTYNRTSLRVIRIREPVAAPAPRRALAEASFFSSPPLLFLLFFFFRFEYIRCEERSAEDKLGRRWHVVATRASSVVGVEGGGCESREPAFAYRSANTLLRATVVSNLPPPLCPSPPLLSPLLYSLKRSCQLINCVRWGGEALFSLRANTSFHVTLFPSCSRAEKFFRFTLENDLP